MEDLKSEYLDEECSEFWLDCHPNVIFTVNEIIAMLKICAYGYHSADKYGYDVKRWMSGLKRVHKTKIATLLHRLPEDVDVTDLILSFEVPIDCLYMLMTRPFKVNVIKSKIGGTDYLEYINSVLHYIRLYQKIYKPDVIR